MADISPARLRTSDDPDTLPAVTVVVPTRNEADNVRPLVERLREALGPTPGEIVFVDDSDDETPRTIAAMAADDPDRVRLVHRPAGSRAGGLGGAVAAGLDTARAPWVVVMDGDLQHPPETVPELLAAAQVDQADAVVASRYRTRGRVAGLGGRFRRIVSRTSGSLAKLFFPLRLGSVTDPMSGFFAVRRDAVPTGDLRPVGYKILLEVLIRSRIERVTEVPYTFRPRVAGESKASLHEGLRFVRHLAGLRVATMRRPHSSLGRMAGFALAGAAGTAVNSAALWALGEVAGLPYLIAAFLAVQVAIVWNFAVIDHLVMPPGERRMRHRFGRFLLLNNTLTPVHLGLLYGLVQFGGLHYLAANVLAIVLVFTIRYLVTSYWVYGAPVSGVGRLWWAMRRTAQTRLAIALLLTSVAFPVLLAGLWNDLWTRGDAVPLIIPSAAAAALVAGRLRPGRDEPDVHDRQVDGLLASACLVAAGALLLLVPDRNASVWLLPAGLAYLAGAAILLVGTRTAARLRWALLLPLVAIGGLVPAGTREAVDEALRSAVAVLRLPDASPVGLAAGQLPGLALLGGVACLAICALVVFGPRPVALARAAIAAVTLAAVAVGAVLIVLAVGRLFGPGAFRVAQLPVLTDLLLVATVVVFVGRWSCSLPVTAPRPVAHQYLPRARFALVALVAVAVLLGVRGLPRSDWQPARAGLAVTTGEQPARAGLAVTTGEQPARAGLAVTTGEQR